MPTKLDADLRALYEHLSDKTLPPDIRRFAEVVQIARMAIDERTVPESEGYTATGGFTQTVNLPGDLPLAVRITIAVGLDDAAPAPPLVRRADQFVEALETAFTEQLRLLHAALD